MVNWCCSECGEEFQAAGACVFCPRCGRHLVAGPPFGYWEEFAFRSICKHIEEGVRSDGSESKH